MIIVALIVAAIVTQGILVFLVIRALWLEGEATERLASDQPSRAQETAVAPTPAPSAPAPFTSRRGVWARSPGIGARYVDGHA